MKKFALISVSDRTGLPELAHALHKKGFTLLATSGTGKVLEESKIPWTSVESYTGLAELLDGRVKTLHPKIHGGILARRDQPHHLQQMEAADIGPIDIVVVNLYPFLSYVQSEKASRPDEMTELVDVGGPTMIRAAAKNHAHVLPLIDPADYPEVIALLGEARSTDLFSIEMRRRLAAKVFTTLSLYDGAIGNYFGSLVSKGVNFPLDARYRSRRSPIFDMVRIRIRKPRSTPRARRCCHYSVVQRGRSSEVRSCRTIICWTLMLVLGCSRISLEIG
jgi:phosphoribosylaminoimidazolecarboxamide formyltransferase/IMP cyclohydrolase